MYCTADSGRAVKVLDFGISKLLDNRSTTQALTVAGDIFGSPFYMSPEQSLGEAVDARSDIYSIGCTLFEMLTGFVPYESESSLEIMQILTKLNKEKGNTIIMVTHEPDIAQYAKRILTMHDGEIIRDYLNPNPTVV